MRGEDKVIENRKGERENKRGNAHAVSPSLGAEAELVACCLMSPALREGQYLFRFVSKFKP